jgi:hypothetical protein
MKREINSHISVIEPIGEAIEKVKVILFRPFSVEKWLVIGLCAWLAYLGTPGGGGNGHVGGGYDGPNNIEGAMAKLEQAWNYFLANLIWIIPVATFVLVAVVTLWLVITWLSSRGHFMFLHCVARNKAEARVPWTEFRSHGNSLFVFRIVVGVIGTVLLLSYIAAATVCILIAYQDTGFTAMVIAGIVLAVMGFILLCIILAVINKFMADFVVPIMFLRTASCMEGWREFVGILSARKGSFFLYILFQVVISIAIGAIVLTAVCITCCCAACFLVIPYVGTVLMLPLLTFKRAYSLCYLRQFGPDFDVFPPAPAPTDGMEVI